MSDALRSSEELADPGSFRPEIDSLQSRDPLEWPGYRAAIDASRAAMDSDESVQVGPATIGGHPIELGVFEFGFLGGSMGEVAGERVARGLERAAARAVPFVLHTKTGGARMQEGMRSLVQMAKVVAARLTLADARRPLVAVLGNPTTGGVLASVAASADFVLAEDDATIGFAGPRVAELLTGRRAAGAHTAESKLKSGLVDTTGDLATLRGYIVELFDVLNSSDAAPAEPADPGEWDRVSGWAAVEAARAPARAAAPRLLDAMCEAAVILRGDRGRADDPALTAAIARMHGCRVVALALDRDHAPGPGAFRKARRCLRLAARLDLPVVTLVDTRGADPSDESEAGGIAWEIAALFEAMLQTPVPIVTLITGEGGSGGALAFAVSDYLIAMSDSIFSVIGPEAAAAILWRDPARAPEAADSLRLGAADLADLGIADEIVSGSLDAHSIARTIAYHLGRLSSGEPADRALARRRRWRSIDAG